MKFRLFAANSGSRNAWVKNISKLIVINNDHSALVAIQNDPTDAGTSGMLVKNSLMINVTDRHRFQARLNRKEGYIIWMENPHLKPRFLLPN